MPRVREIDSFAAMNRYRAAWHALWKSTPGASIFHSLEWLETYWRHFGEGQLLRMMVVGDDDERPEGFVPLVVRREPTRVGPIRVLTYPLHDWGSFFGPIGPRPHDLLVAALDRVRRTPRNWDLLELRWVGAPGTDAMAVPQAMRDAGMHPLETEWDRSAVVRLDGTWDDYLAARPRVWRRNYRHWQRHLAAAGRVEYFRHRPQGSHQADDDPRWDLYDACEEIARRSWQAASSGGTTLCDEAVRPFLRDVHAVAARLGTLDMSLLLFDGKPAAFTYAYHHNGYVYGLRVGYDPAHSRHGVGSVLLAETLRDSFRRGDHLFDMGVGSLHVKRHLITELLPVRRYSHFPAHCLRVQVIRARRWAEARNLVAPRVHAD